MFCSNCGKLIESNALFCPYCGNALSKPTEYTNDNYNNFSNRSQKKLTIRHQVKTKIKNGCTLGVIVLTIATIALVGLLSSTGGKKNNKNTVKYNMCDVCHDESAKYTINILSESWELCSSCYYEHKQSVYEKEIDEENALDSLRYTNPYVSDGKINDTLYVTVTNSSSKTICGSIKGYIYYKGELKDTAILFLPEGGLKPGEKATISGIFNSVNGYCDRYSFETSAAWVK